MLEIREARPDDDVENPSSAYLSPTSVHFSL